MKEICQCNCSSPATAYRTPWCSMLRGGEPTEILHLWYKLEWLRKEVEKRSSYLGKFRRTEEAQHLLDLIAMTEDEVDLFIPYARAAMADVFDVLNTYMPKREKAIFFREGKETIILPDVPDEDSLLHLSQLDADNVDGNGFIVADTIPVDADGYIQISETGVDADGYIVPEDHPTGPLVYFHAGDYVQYKGELYMAIADGDSHDFVGKLVPTEDYRDSVHYGLNWHCCGSNINAVEPLDTAIFEALVARIIYKWLCMSYPAEAERYQAEWLEHLASIKTRCNILNGPQIVNRIPRLF